MTPTWVSPCGMASLYLADCLTVLPHVEADCIVADPPYGMAHPCNFASRGRGNLAECNDWQDVAGDAEPFDPSPLLSMNLPTVLWGANWFADKLPPVSGWLVWDKRVQQGVGVNDQADGELAWTNCIKGTRIFRHMWNGMWRDSERGEHYHPTQKPVALFEWLLGFRWIPEGTVFDPYMGSGPCGIAAIRSGRRYVGCELAPEHFETAQRRIEAELGRFPLFPEPQARQLELIAG